jgi:hypothetical protein
MRHREELKKKAQEAINKSAVLGPDIHLEDFDKSDVSHRYIIGHRTPFDSKGRTGTIDHVGIGFDGKGARRHIFSER